MTDAAPVPVARSPLDTVAARVRRDGDALVFSGALLRDAVAGLWRDAQALRAGAVRLDLRAASQVDSAGLALLAVLAGGTLEIVGAPAGLEPLREAYRLDPSLAFSQ